MDKNKTSLKISSYEFFDDVLEQQRIFNLSGMLHYADSSFFTGLNKWETFYNELEKDCKNKGLFPELVDIHKKAIKNYISRDIIPIGIINAKFISIKKEAIKSKDFNISKEGNVFINRSVPGNMLIDEYEIFASAFLKEIHKAGTYNFIVNDEFYFSNINKKIDHYIIDFDDGNGEQIVEKNSVVSVNYKESGTKNLTLKPIYKNSKRLLKSSTTKEKAAKGTVTLKSAHIPIPNSNYSFEVTSTITDFTYNPIGHPDEKFDNKGKAKVKIWLAEGENASMDYFDKPVILIDGFDPDEQRRDCDSLYRLARSWNETDNVLKSRCYDIVTVNWIGGGDWIQKNAFALVEVLKKINELKKGCNPNVLIGPSMGGIIGRYALSYMEKHNIPHEVGVFIANDSPHRGANIALGIQALLKHFSSQSDAAENLYNQLCCPASRQLLLYHIDRDDKTSIGWMREQLLAELESLGNYPEKPKLIGMASGSGIGKNQYNSAGEEMQAGDLIYHLEMELFGTILANASCWGVNPGQIIYFGWYYDYDVWFTGEIVITFNIHPYMLAAPSNARAIDNAPGGFYPHIKEGLENVEAPAFKKYMNITTDVHFPFLCYMPIPSALDIDTDDLHYTGPEGKGPVASETPFDIIIYTKERQTEEENLKLAYPNNYNEEHCYITKEKQVLLMKELGNGFGDDLLIQNKDLFIPNVNRGVWVQANKTIEAGNNVDPTIPPGDVTIKAGNNVYFVAENKIVLKPGFKVEHGAHFVAEIKSPELICEGINTLKSKATKIYHKTDNKDTFAFKSTRMDTTQLDNQKKHKITVYPNPTKGNFKVAFNYVPKKTTIQLFNSKGRLQYQNSYEHINQLNLNITPWAKGLYLVKIINDKEIFTQKILYQ